MKTFFSEFTMSNSSDQGKWFPKILIITVLSFYENTPSSSLIYVLFIISSLNGTYFLLLGNKIDSYVSYHLENLFIKQTQPWCQSLKILSAMAP